MAIRRSCVECTVRAAHYFCGLSTEALKRLDRMGTQVLYTERQRVIEEGGAPENLYVVCGGTLKVTTSSHEGRMLLLRIVGPGDVLGLAAVLKGTSYEATAEVLEECEVRRIARADFLKFLEEFQGVGFNSAEAVSREYDAAVLSARRLALAGSAAGKLASVLLDWGRMGVRHGCEPLAEEGELRFRMPLTHEELGQMAGISRETATRVLSKLKAEGLIEIEGELIVVRSPKKLERLYC